MPVSTRIETFRVASHNLSTGFPGELKLENRQAFNGTGFSEHRPNICKEKLTSVMQFQMLFNGQYFLL